MHSQTPPEFHGSHFSGILLHGVMPRKDIFEVAVQLVDFNGCA